LQALPAPTQLSLLQDCCRELQISDAMLLPSALRKMCRALAALPPMETFIRDVCALVLSHGAPEEAAAGKVASTQLVLGVLKT